ncbi:hypothetical protein UlMin_033965 [Ulmus minor]
MGCANSKLDDLPAVALCRDRCKFLDEALRHSQAFADAHAAYLGSLKAIGPALHRFFDQNPQSKLDPVKSPLPASSPHHSLSSSKSESHLPFPSDSDSDDIDKDFNSSSRVRFNYLNENETQGLISSNYGLDSKPPPSPPPASATSAWDFLNLFDTYERYERLYISNSDREAPEKVKFDGDEKFGEESVKKNAEEGKKSKEDGEKKTNEVRVVEKGDKTTEGKSETASKSAETTMPSGKPVAEVTSEIQILFKKASESGNEVFKLIYHRQKIAINQNYCRLGVEEDLGFGSQNMSSTLNKLLLWEKKLYQEVKAEEKLRTIHEKKFQQLKQLDKKAAGAQKANAIRALLRDLSTNLKIAFQIVDRSSIAINTLRDQEFWTQIKELNHRLLPMWKAMLECHKSQHQAVAEAKGLDAITSNVKLTDSHLEAALQLKIELLNWNLSFSNWISTQKEFVKSLNDWLLRCLMYEPEETPDGIMPFSPGRLGAPPVFVILNHWSHATDRLSEKEVMEAIRGFIASIDLFLEKHNVDLQQIVIADKAMETKVKFLEKEEQKMQKVIQSREKLVFVLAGHKQSSKVLNQNETCTSSNFQIGLKRIFTAMEKFMTNSIEVYEELCLRIEEVHNHF